MFTGTLQHDNSVITILAPDSTGYRERIFAALWAARLFRDEADVAVLVGYNPRQDRVALLNNQDNTTMYYEVTSEASETIQKLNEIGFTYREEYSE